MENLDKIINSQDEYIKLLSDELNDLAVFAHTFGAIFRLRHALAYAVHKFYNDKGFVYLHTPIVTASDAEGAGEMFRVTTLPMDGSAERNEDGSINYKEDLVTNGVTTRVSKSLDLNLTGNSIIFVLTDNCSSFISKTIKLFPSSNCIAIFVLVSFIATFSTLKYFLSLAINLDAC